MTDASKLPDKLGNILEKEYAALLGGDLDGIAKMGLEKVQLLERISALPISEVKRFEPFRGVLLRNQELMHRSMAGMRTAVLRVKEVRDVTAVLRTYGSDGRKSGVSMSAGRSLSKRS